MPNELLKRRALSTLTVGVVMAVLDIFLIRAKTGPIALLIILTIVVLGYGGWTLWQATRKTQ